MCADMVGWIFISVVLTVCSLPSCADGGATMGLISQPSSRNLGQASVLGRSFHQGHDFFSFASDHMGAHKSRLSLRGGQGAEITPMSGNNHIVAKAEPKSLPVPIEWKEARIVNWRYLTAPSSRSLSPGKAADPHRRVLEIEIALDGIAPGFYSPGQLPTLFVL